MSFPLMPYTGRLQRLDGLTLAANEGADAGAFSATVSDPSPVTLFSSGEYGLYYDFTDTTTLFQDQAGATPVSAYGQNVQRVLDKSGRGKHAYWPTGYYGGSPPKYARIPAGGVRNIMTHSNNFTNTGAWTNGSATITLNADGVAQKVTPTGTLCYFGRAADVFIPASNTYTWSARMKSAGKRYVWLQVNIGAISAAYTFDLQTATVGNYLVLGGGGLTSPSAAIVLEGDGYCRVSMTFTTGGTTNVNCFGGPADALNSRNTTVNGADGIFVRNAQLEQGSTATIEQTVVERWDVTQPGKADKAALYTGGGGLLSPMIWDYAVYFDNVTVGAMYQNFGGTGFVFQQAKENTVTGDRLWWGTSGNYGTASAQNAQQALLMGVSAIDAISQPSVAFQKTRLTYTADLSDNLLRADVNGATGNAPTATAGAINFSTTDRMNYYFHGIYGNAINSPLTAYVTGLLIRQGVLTGSDRATMESWLDSTIN